MTSYNLDLKEIKIVLDWAQSKVDIAKGSKISNPENFQRVFDRWKNVKDLFDKECENWIKMNCNSHDY